MKCRSNVYTRGFTRARYFYLKRNKGDSIPVYGDDDIDKPTAIDTRKNR
jgi:hypothetical protein